MTINGRIFHSVALTLVLALGLWMHSLTAQAADLPTAAGSPIAGISFDDRPLILPIQRNFQMAMLTASSELGRSCGRMEAYGWRLGDNEQERVNQIFDNTVDRMRAQGYGVETKSVSTVSRDVTLFTADRSDKHLIFMWSAGEIGLVMVLCETSAPMPAIPTQMAKNVAEAQGATFPSTMPSSRAVSDKVAPTRFSVAGKPIHENFSPVGDWAGDYTCPQGTTGATLHIGSLKGDQFEGTFQFYPTAKNPYVPRGKYLVFGEYDRDSQRILINPGKWIERPKDFYNTIMIGSFDPVNKSFSGYFQGITGCTSFEARNNKAAAALTSSGKGKADAAKTTAAPKPKKAKAKAKKPAAPKKETKASAKPDAGAPVALTSDGLEPIPNTPMDIKPSSSNEATGDAAPRASAIEPLPPATGIDLPTPATK